VRTTGRRALLRTGIGAATLGIAGGTLPAGSAGARAPLAGRQAPGIYRFRVGTFEMTVLTSGTLAFPVRVIWPHAPEAELGAILGADFQPTDTSTPQVNVLAVNTGERLVLVDLGSGGKLFETAGALPASLAAAGIRPEDVDAVVFTHAHPDHLFGATDAGGTRLLYPNAEYVIADTEWDFWTAPDRAADANTDRWRELVRLAQGNLRAIEPRLRRIRPGAEVLPGITSIDTAGHTPGHISLHLVSGRDELLCSGDVFSNRAVSFQRPDWPFGFDKDAEKGAKARRSLLDQCATDKVLVANYHLPFPGVGHVARDGTGFRWVPVDWSWQM
jgi:glyoxylase-like metal-dependent hydrolase (beta-lactamase superfamily II)